MSMILTTLASSEKDSFTGLFFAILDFLHGLLVDPDYDPAIRFTAWLCLFLLICGVSTVLGIVSETMDAEFMGILSGWVALLIIPYFIYLAMYLIF